MNDISVFEKTISKEDCNNLILLLKKNTEAPTDTQARLLDISDPLIHTWGEQFYLNILNKYLLNYPTESLESYQLYKLQHIYYKKDTSCPLHVDCEYSEGYVRNIAMVLYLNEEYEGGELLFPTKNFAVKPKAGTCVLFPAGYSYPHGTNECSAERHGISFVIHKVKENIRDFYE
jgi:hypothetical protein